MAIFSPGPLISSIHGSIGGVTFRRTAGAPTIQTKPRHCKTFSPVQVNRRMLFDLARYYWANVCTAKQRTAWSALARQLNTSRFRTNSTTLSGRMLFFRQYLVPWFVPYNITDPIAALLGQPIPFATVDFTVGGPYLVDFDPCPHAYYGPIQLRGVRNLPAPAWTTVETSIGFQIIPHVAGVYDIHLGWVNDLGECSPGEHFCLYLYHDPKGPNRIPVYRVYGTAHA
jgi:hypothetical protein